MNASSINRRYTATARNLYGGAAILDGGTIAQLAALVVRPSPDGAIVAQRQALPGSGVYGRDGADAGLKGGCMGPFFAGRRSVRCYRRLPAPSFPLQ